MPEWRPFTKAEFESLSTAEKEKAMSELLERLAATRKRVQRVKAQLDKLMRDRAARNGAVAGKKKKGD